MGKLDHTIEIPAGTSIVRLSSRKIKEAISDPEKAAKAVKLVYVSDSMPGIRRIKKGKSFSYVYNNKTVTDKECLQRIRKLVIPPAWKNVWICSRDNGHLQVTGLDMRKRKQYKYHPLWNTLRNHTKFYRLYEFGRALPAMRLHLEKDLALPGLPFRKVIASVVALLERTNIRVGNASYEKIYGSYGLSTMKDKHVKVEGTDIRFSFKGKKGIYHKITLRNKRLAKIVQACRDIPGQELFQYYDEDGTIRSIDSGMVNDYIREISQADFTAKDFRTWAGTLQAVRAFKELGLFTTATEAKQKIAAALDIVSGQLGNTRTVCKKYYVHPVIISLYESNSLGKYLNELDTIEKNDALSDLTTEENVLMKILKSPAP